MSTLPFEVESETTDMDWKTFEVELIRFNEEMQRLHEEMRRSDEAAVINGARREAFVIQMNADFRRWFGEGNGAW